MKKVGKDKIQVGEKLRKLAYRDISFDNDGWVDAKEYVPTDYDIVFLNIKNKKISCGWSIGLKWYGLNLKEDDEVLYWKRKSDEKLRCKTVLH